MQVSCPNNIKIYNLSVGKSLPEWLSDRKKRTLQKQDIDLRRRIDLLQDFDMPIVSHCVDITRDGQYIYATGVYKPRVKCFDTSQMSLKFERCLDSEVTRFKVLSDDYSKVVFLQNDRYVEVHSQSGRYYRTRIPKFGRDFDYHPATCDLYFVGASLEICRLNLELGRFMTSLKTNAEEIFCCEFNPAHGLFTCGTNQGTLECWDPRTKRRVGLLDVTLNTTGEFSSFQNQRPSVSAVKFGSALDVAVGTSSGHVLIFDLRSDKPLIVKDHLYNLPIKRIAFHDEQGLVLSIDKKILKLWDKHTGKPFTSIEPGTALNDLSMYPNSGLLLMATEAPKLLTYHIPSLGAAPRWCSFLDNLTEELEECPTLQVYDDYQFVTRTDLEDLGLSHLIGSNLLRAYMHGFFLDRRLYNKAKSIAEPLAYQDYKKRKIREKIDEERSDRVKVKKLPKVNSQLALKLMEQKQMSQLQKNISKATKDTDLLTDDRFSAMFSDPAFQVDTDSVDYKLLNPVLSKIEKSRKNKTLEENINEEMDSSSSDDDHQWTEELKRQYKIVQEDYRSRRKYERQRQEGNKTKENRGKFFEMRDSKLIETEKNKLHRSSLGDRITESSKDSAHHSGTGIGVKESTFSLKKNKRELEQKEESRRHHAERRKIRRSASELKNISK